MAVFQSVYGSLSWVMEFAVVLLLLFFVLCASHCLWGFCAGLCFCYALLYVLSSFVIILTRKREGWLLCFYCLLDVLLL